jgi:hypothetical protein
VLEISKLLLCRLQRHTYISWRYGMARAREERSCQLCIPGWLFGRRGQGPGRWRRRAVCAARASVAWVWARARAGLQRLPGRAARPACGLAACHQHRDPGLAAAAQSSSGAAGATGREAAVGGPGQPRTWTRRAGEGRWEAREGRQASGASGHTRRPCRRGAPWAAVGNGIPRLISGAEYTRARGTEGTYLRVRVGHRRRRHGLERLRSAAVGCVTVLARTRLVRNKDTYPYDGGCAIDCMVGGTNDGGWPSAGAGVNAGGWPSAGAGAKDGG